MREFTDQELIRREKAEEIKEILDNYQKKLYNELEV